MRDYKEFLKHLDEFIFIEDELEVADIIVVPGNRYAKNAENAAELYAKGFAPIIVPSGKFAKNSGGFLGVLDSPEKYTGNYSTEGEFLADVLKINGVPDKAILQENEATYTYENALFTKELLDKNNITPNTGIICCRNTHARRCLMYFQTVFPDTKWLVYPGVIDNISKENWKSSQEGIELVMGEATRVVMQFELWM